MCKDIFDKTRKKQTLHVCDQIAMLAQKMQWKLDARMEEHGDDFTKFSIDDLFQAMKFEIDEFEESGFDHTESADVCNYALFLSWLAMTRRYHGKTDV